jgi:hypothetical protein
MPQARGAAQRLLLQKETSFRTVGAAAAKLIPFTTWGVQRSPNRQENNTIDASPLPAKRDTGDPSAAGSFESILDLRSIGNWLQLMLGVATVGKAVTNQPTNITGVTVQYAASDCTTGNGTLTFLIAGTTLAWTAPSGTIGTAVNISAGGDFALQSGGGGKTLTVTVTAGSIPAGNQTDSNIAVSATLKAHVFPIDNVIRPSALAEMQNPDVTKYFRWNGVKVNKLSSDVLNNDQNISGDLICGVEVDPVPTAVFDAAPTSYSYARACSAKGRVWDGNGTTLGDLAGGTWSMDNQMTGISYTDGQEGYGTIDQGDLLMSGSLRAVFDGATAWNLARLNTSTRMRIEQSCLVSADTFKLVQDYPSVELDESAPERQGKSGLYVPITWRAHRNGTQLPKVILVNDVASY